MKTAKLNLKKRHLRMDYNPLDIALQKHIKARLAPYLKQKEELKAKEAQYLQYARRLRYKKYAYRIPLREENKIIMNSSIKHFNKRCNINLNKFLSQVSIAHVPKYRYRLYLCKLNLLIKYLDNV